MSSAAQVDYDALAQQHGGSAAIDYDALAQQHGGSSNPDLATVVHKSFSGQTLTPEEKQFADQQLPVNSQQLAQSYARAGQAALGGGGLQNVAASDGSSLLRMLYNSPKVKPVVDSFLSETMHLPYAKTAKAAWDSVGKSLSDFFTQGAGGGLKEVEGTEGAAKNAAGELEPPASAEMPATQQAQPEAEADAPRTTPSTEPVPPSMRTLSGESALRKILTGQDNANLLKIAKSRGINVTKEALLKPGTADNQIINKIVDDFQPEEFDEIGARYLENTRMGRHNFGDIGPEAWKTLSLQSYFPDLKIPATQLARTSKAIATAGAAGAPDLPIALPPGQTEGDLSPLLQESLKRARAARAAKLSVAP